MVRYGQRTFKKLQIHQPTNGENFVEDNTIAPSENRVKTELPIHQELLELYGKIILSQ